MKAPGIEEMLETFEAKRRRFAYLGVDAAQRAGLLAVFETHVKGMLAEAFAAGDSKIPGYGERPEGYAERILSQLKEPRHD